MLHSVVVEDAGVTVLDVEAVVAVVDSATWPADAVSLPEGWERVRLEAVLTRPAPRSRRVVLGRGPAFPDVLALGESRFGGRSRG